LREFQLLTDVARKSEPSRMKNAKLLFMKYTRAFQSEVARFFLKLTNPQYCFFFGRTQIARRKQFCWAVSLVTAWEIGA